MKTIDELINENDNFKGTKKVETSYKKFRNLQTVAEKLQRFLDCEVKSEDPDDNTHRNCVLSVTCRYPMMLNNFNQRAAFAELFLNSDDAVVTANPQKKTIRYSFGVRGIWE